MDKTYQYIKPSEVYYSIVNEEKTAPEQRKEIVLNEYGNYPTNNDYIDLFAGLIRKYGYRPVAFYADIMGPDSRHFSGAIIAMTGMEPRRWIHEYLNLAICDFVENTDLSFTDIGKRFNFSRVSFSRFFKLMNKCQPYEWRMLKLYGKKFRYHGS